MADRSRGAARVTSLVDRLAAAARLVVTGQGPTQPPAAEWFGPGAPLAPVAPPETAGRRFDFPFARNTQVPPRGTEPVTFATLRALADAHDLTRLAIETRKDQMARIEWTLARRDGQDAEPPPDALDFFARPDREHAWPTWLRMWLEEVFVPDAATLYLRRTRGGRLYALEILDGTTIEPKLDPWGRRPVSPEPAYQQVLHGMPGVDYTSEELIYAPRNPRVHKVYGYSQTEQIVVTVNIALRRQAQQLSRLDDSNIPPALIGVPSTWTPTQISEFQTLWDTLTSGAHNAAERSKARFVPGDTKATMLSTEPLFGEAEEWLARLVCWAFSLPPTALVKMNNRATAETVQDAAEDEGLAPLMLYVKGVLDRVIQAPEGLGLRDWEWRWKTARPLEPSTQAVIDVAYINARVRTPEQVGMDRFGSWEAPTEANGAPPAPVAPAAPGAKDGGTAAKDGAPNDAGPEAAKAAGRSLRRRERGY